MRIYRVTFNAFTNGMRTTVTDGNLYLELPRHCAFLIREIDIPKYIKFGEGFSELTCVGDLDDTRII